MTIALLGAGCVRSGEPSGGPSNVGPTQEEVDALAAEMTPEFCAEVAARETAFSEVSPEAHAEAWAEIAPHAPSAGLRDHIDSVVAALRDPGSQAGDRSAAHVSTGALATAARSKCGVEIASVGVIDNR